MGDLRARGKYQNKQGYVEVDIPLISFKEDDTIIIYSPALDLSGYGENEEEARNSFGIALEEFIKYTLNKKTLKSELEKLGWKLINKKSHKTYVPPYLNHLLSSKEYLSNIVNEKDFKSYRQKIQMPAYA